MLFTSLQSFLYKNVAKPIFFKMDAEFVHDRATGLGNLFGRTAITRAIVRLLYQYKDPILEQDVRGIHFVNPIGLSAGFDYDAKLINILPAVGFGFNTVGTITNEPYEGNARPRLGRLPKSKSLLVNKGFKSDGMEKNLKRIDKSKPQAPLGISIGSTNKNYGRFEDQVADVVAGFVKALEKNPADYYELNISCPNLSNIKDDAESFSTPGGFEKLLSALSELESTKPVFVKMHLEKTEEETATLIDIAARYGFIKGFIFSNLCKDRSNPAFVKSEIEKAGKGNFSGKPTFAGSNKLIEFVYKRYGDRFTIIGCGGVFSAEDAYEKIRSGASLVQMISGMIFEGPQVIGKINRDLAKLFKRDGFRNVSEAVGSKFK